MAEPTDSYAEGNVCPSCGKHFVCGMTVGEKVCWCARLPALPGLPDPALGCLCPDCLSKKLAAADQAPA